MNSQFFILQLTTINNFLGNEFTTATGTRKESIAALMKESHKIMVKLEKLIVSERLNKHKMIQTLREKIEFDIETLKLHMEQEGLNQN